MFKNIDLDLLIKKAVEEKVEITISVEPGRTEIQIQPWKPFVYTCPNANKE